jgi:hypothetical protein
MPSLAITEGSVRRREQIMVEQIFDVGGLIVCLIVGVWATAFAYGLVESRIIGRFQWSSRFRYALRWLGPLLVALCVGALLMVLR